MKNSLELLIPRTAMQRQIFEFIVTYFREHGKEPNLTQVAKHFNRRVPTIHEHIKAMRGGDSEPVKPMTLSFCPNCGFNIKDFIHGNLEDEGKEMKNDLTIILSTVVALLIIIIIELAEIINLLK